MSPTIVEIMQKMLGALETEKAKGVDAVVHFEFTGAEAGEWYAVIRDAKCTIGQGMPKSRPTISLTVDSSDFVHVLTGEMDGPQAVMDGKLKVGGDIMLAPKLLKLFRLKS